MPDLPSFYLPSSQWNEPYVLEGQEHVHMTRALRMQPGDRGRLFNGCGREALFTISTIQRKKTELSLQESTFTPRPESSLHLALGWNRTTRRNWFFEKAVELEASGILFWQAEMSQGSVPSTPKRSWHGQLVAGAKQCRNLWLPELDCRQGGVAELVDLRKGFDHFLFLWEKSPCNTLIHAAQLALPGRTLVVIGPEGGVSDSEAYALQNGGFKPASLGRRILRWETAALLCLGLGLWQRNLQQNDLEQE